MSNTIISGQALRELRQEAGLSIRAFADALGLPFPTYNNRENRSKKKYLEYELAEKVAEVLSKHGIDSKRVYALVSGPNNPFKTGTLKTRLKGSIISDAEILQPSQKETICLPNDIERPHEIEVYRIGDDSMADTGLVMGATIFARPVWLGRGSFGTGSTVILKQARPDGIITASVRFLHAEPGGPFMASARSANPAYQPKLVPDDANYHSATDDPAHGSSPRIYAVVEQAELDLKS